MLVFDDRFVRELPGDLDQTNVPRRVDGACHTFVDPSPVREPRLIIASDEVAQRLGIPIDALARPPLLDVLAGNDLLPGMKPYAACYGGHQFGSWAGQLGDGRAITLGELVTPTGTREEIQLKGAGPTPYSRRADGRAVLRSSLREFVCSEAMHHLGVPTTRALALVTTGERVLRDMLYDGRAGYEPGAIVTRVAPSFLRFGNVQIFASRGEHEISAAILDHAIRWHFPHLAGTPKPAAYAALLLEIAERTAETIAHWMRVGFVHGVMNTDNMSLLGLTIDYGPFGFLEGFDPRWTPNTTDAHGRRYAYGNQPRIGAWNVARLAEAMAPVLEGELDAQAAIDRYADHFSRVHAQMIADKLGFHALERDPDRDDTPLVEAMFDLLGSAEIDWTLFFRALMCVPVDASSWRAPSEAAVADWMREAFYDPSALTGVRLRSLVGFLDAWAARSRREEPEARFARMSRANPVYVPRNWLLQVAIDALNEGDAAELEQLVAVMRSPYEERAGLERFAEKRPEWARHKVGCSMLSCSS
jgi:serine/tyrosine/threonine adenylyltransferase